MDRVGKLHSPLSLRYGGWETLGAHFFARCGLLVVGALFSGVSTVFYSSLGFRWLHLRQSLEPILFSLLRSLAY